MIEVETCRDQKLRLGLEKQQVLKKVGSKASNGSCWISLKVQEKV